MSHPTPPIVDVVACNDIIPILEFIHAQQKENITLFEFDKKFWSYMRAPRVRHRTTNSLGSVNDVLIEIKANKPFRLCNDMFKISMSSHCMEDGSHMINLEGGFPCVIASFYSMFHIDNLGEGDIELEHIHEVYYHAERQRLMEMHSQFVHAYSPPDDMDDILNAMSSLSL
jgi:hypothetical protein